LFQTVGLKISSLPALALKTHYSSSGPSYQQQLYMSLHIKQYIKYLQDLLPHNLMTVDNRKYVWCHILSFLKPEFNDE
jgi:hypothetical protein